MKKLIIANWKMNPGTTKEALRLANAVGSAVKKIKNTEVVLAPPFIFTRVLKGLGKFKLGAQDVFWERGGAYTGEISALQLRNIGVSHVIVGHSERRALGETDEIINKKLKAVLASGLQAVLCVGEEKREKDTAFPEVIRNELRKDLHKISKRLLSRLIIAYEPIWAIGTGRSGTPRDVYEMAILIRRELYKMFGKHIAGNTPVLYGGSVDEKNAEGFIIDGHVDGLLVGGASVNSKKFAKILEKISAKPK